MGEPQNRFRLIDQSRAPFEPLPERPVLDVRRDPVDLLVELDHAVLDGGDLHEPRAHRLVDERRVGAPAVRVAVGVGLGLDQRTGRLQIGGDGAVGVEHLLTRVGRDLAREPGPVVDRAHHGDARRLADVEVLLAEPRSQMHDAGALVGGDEVGPEHPERAGLVGEEREEGAVGATDQCRAGELRQRLGVAEELGVGGGAVSRDHGGRRPGARTRRTRCRARRRGPDSTAGSTVSSSTPSRAVVRRSRRGWSRCRRGRV